MLAALPGRGRAGAVNHGAVSFGHRELWADGAEQGATQTALSVRGLTVAADARLDNRLELAGILGLASADENGARDCDLILMAYERWGSDCPLRLHGDYAFALWDPAKRMLLCARDAVGARPFCYSLTTDGRFAFASDTAACLAAPGVDEGLDEAHAAAFLRGEPTDVDSTFFRAVRSLPPGHCIEVGADTERIRRWWRPEDAPEVRLGSDEEYERAFLDHYSRAVRDRLRDALPLGVHLSGGLDSSSIAALAARELRPLGQLPHAFCWHPPPNQGLTEAEADEYRLIESICGQEGLAPCYHAITPNHVLALLRRDGARYPNRDGTLVHEAQVQQSAAAAGVRVILSGWGGDELASHSGAGYYTGLLKGGRWRQLLREARGLSDKPWRFVARNAVLPLAHFRAAEIAANLLKGEMPRRRKVNFVNPALARKRRKRRYPVRVTSVRRDQLARLQGGHLAQRMEDWGASGAREGVEYRFPLLDRRLIEFVLGMPAEQFRHGARSRWFMRRALRPVLPAAVLEQSVKRDPARFRAMQAAIDEALPEIRRHLHARAEPPARSGYLDMAKLRARLEAAARNSAARRGKFFRALQFLDWWEE